MRKKKWGARWYRWVVSVALIMIQMSVRWDRSVERRAVHEDGGMVGSLF